MAGRRLSPTWERQKLGERKQRTSRETPARSGRMRAWGPPIRCAARLLTAYWLLPHAPVAAAAAAMLNAGHAGLLFACCRRIH